MSDPIHPAGDDPAIDLVPRMTAQGYSPAQVEARREWIERKLGLSLRHIGASSIPTEEMRGNIENPIGAAQMPLGLAGPLLVHGEHAQGVFYVPLATTEGALVRSYERGMVTITRAGGATVRVERDENVVSPVFLFESVAAAHAFAAAVPAMVESLRTEAEATTRHGRLLGVECRQVGRDVIVDFRYSTGDAQGMNMIVKATQRAAEWLAARGVARRYYIFSGHSSEKRPSGRLLAGGKGKRVTAGVRVPGDLLRTYLRVTPRELVDVWQHSVLGHLQAGALGFNAHCANGLTAMFVACGQDVANVANAAVGITHYDLVDEDLYASVTLPSLTVATVGGGTGLGTSRECLQILDCAGAGRARRFAEIVTAAVLAGELSMAAAIGAGEFVDAHETYGRNRPPADAT